MNQQPLHTQVWLLIGLTGSEPGVLRLARSRLTFTTSDGRRVFDVALSEVRDVEFPWYYFGGGMKLSVGAERYRISFMRPGNTGGRLRDIGRGRQAGKEWKSALASRT